MPPARRAAVAVSIATCLACSLGAPRAARADCASPLTSACINDDTLWPHAGPSRFVGVGGTETTAERRIGFGLVTSYLSRPVVLHLPSPGPGGSDQNAINDQVNATFVFAYGVTSRLELGVALPVTLGQGGSGTGPLTGGADLRDTATRDLRFGVAYALVPRARVEPSLADAAHASPNVYALTARFETSAPTGDATQLAGERGAVFLPTLAGDYRRGRFFGGAELGARVRPTAELAGSRVGTQALLGLGAGVDLLPREQLALLLEARALPTFAEQHDATQTANGVASTPNGKHIVPAEWSLGVRTAPLAGGDLAITLAGGGGLPLAGDLPITTPRARFTLGIAYAPRALDSDGDGVLDADDRCPSVRGARTAREPGCPGPPPDDATMTEGAKP